MRDRMTALPLVGGQEATLTAAQELSATSPEREARLQREIERCQAEIATAERLLRNGHPDLEGLCLALADWSAELQLLERSEEHTSELQSR